MIAVLIFVISVVTLLQFFVSYSRSLIVESRRHTLSGDTLQICGMTAGKMAGDQFQRLVQLIALCPEPGAEGRRVQTVSVYFKLLGFARLILNWAIPSVARWIEAEREGCAYVAAVVLDRRIAYTRVMMAEQAGH